MSSPTLSDIFQNDTEILEKQWQEIQQRHEKEQQLLTQLKEAAKSCWAECTAQKAKKKAEEKAWEEAESCGGEEKKKENNGVPLATLGQDVRRKGCPIGGG